MISALSPRFALLAAVSATLFTSDSFSAELTFERISLDQGLSQSTVYCILQDSRGYLWLGTEDGLNKYDGYQFVTIRQNPFDHNSLPSNDISALLEDPAGRIWIGTWGGGLSRYDPVADLYTHYRANENDPDSLNSSQIQALYQASDSTIWVGCNDGGLSRYEAESDTFRTYRHDPHDASSISHDRVWRISEGRSGHLWVATENGLCRLDPGTGRFERFQHNPQRPDSLIQHNTVRSVLVDAHGLVWVGTEQGLTVFNEDRTVVRHYGGNGVLPNDRINTIYEGDDGVIWLGSYGGGLIRTTQVDSQFFPVAFASFTHDGADTTSISHNDVRSVLIDHSEILWVGTRRGGLNKITLRASGFQRGNPALPQGKEWTNNEVTAIATDADGHLLLGTNGGGLQVMSADGNWLETHVHRGEHADSIANDRINVIAPDEQGRFWIGTEGGGISIWLPEEGRFVNLQHDPESPETISHNRVRDILPLSKDRVWVATRMGLNRLTLEAGLDQVSVLRYYNNPDIAESLSNDEVQVVAADMNEEIWVGTSRGLNRLDQQSHTFQRFIHDPDDHSTLSNDEIIDLYADTSGNLWIGTKNGFNRLETGHDRFWHWTIGDGLPNGQINGILEDDHGYLWLSTNRGISRFDPSTLSFTNYGTGEGLQSAEFIKRSRHKRADGRLYFGGINGYNHFRPEQIKSNHHVPPIVITMFKVLDRTLNPMPYTESGRELVLTHRDNFLQFEFAALDFTSPEDNLYRFKLEGFDQNWQGPGRRRFASYTNLPGGRYTFRLKGANNNGIWNETGTRMRIRIKPPFYRTPAFLIMVPLLLLLALVLGHQVRTYRIRARNQQLEAMVSERTQSLREAQQQLIATAHKAGIAEVTTGVLHNVGNLLNSINIAGKMIDETLASSRLRNMKKANRLLDEYRDTMQQLPKGTQLIDYYLGLETALNREHAAMKKELKLIIRNIELMGDIISAQQDQARAGAPHEDIDFEELIDQALEMQYGSISIEGVKVERVIQAHPVGRFPRVQLIHVLTNLIKNAIEAMAANPSKQKPMLLRIGVETEEPDWIVIRIEDNGSGFDPADKPKIFRFGFSTKTDGHGFGMHSVATTMKHLGGTIDIHSDGVDRGATATLRLPLPAKADSAS